MQPISIRTTENQFILSIDKQWVDNEAFVLFIEKLKQKILAKEENLDETLQHFKPETPLQTSRFVVAQQFKSSANPAYDTSKLDVYEQ